MKRVELFINNTLVDLNERGLDSLFIITKQIQDIREPDKKQADFSRNIQIPGSKNNDTLFSYSFEISREIQNTSSDNFNPDFNPNLKANAVAYLDGVEFFTGIAQLTQINVLYKKHVVYNITLLGKIANIFTDIGEQELTDIDFSDLNHTYNAGNIVPSWTATVGQNYVYPLIDHGFSPDLQNFSVSNMYPAIYVKEYIDRIFDNAGFTYESAFFDSSFFKHLIIPFNSPTLKLTSDQVLARKFRASNTFRDSILVPVGASNSSGVVLVFDDETTAPNFDSSGQYNPSNGRFTCSLAGVYTFASQTRVTGTFIPATPGVTVRSQQKIRVYLEFVLLPVVGNSTPLSSAYIDIDTGQTTFQTTYTTANPGLSSPIDPHYTNSPFSPRNYINTIANNVQLGVGDQIAVRARTYLLKNQYGDANNVQQSQKFEDMGSPGTFYDGNIYLNIEAGSLFYNTIDNTQIIEGQVITMNNAIPKKVKQKDFLISIFKMFNLYVEQDKEKENNYIIEPRNSYYNNTVIDLTYKRDLSQDLIIKPMGALDWRKYIFKYKEDKDYYNTLYNDSHQLDYGEREVVVDNDFIKGTKSTELIFSPTPSVGSITSDRVIPRIIKVSDTGIVSSHEGNIRILYYGGLKDTNQVWNLNSSGQVYTFDQYPYAGHLDDPYNSNYDLNWLPPEEIYWFPIFHDIWYTSNNLYNANWRQFIEEITDKNSKMVTGWFRLNAMDINSMDFRNLYFFDDEYFRLNKIIDYNPVSEGLTQCEFIKIKAAVPFQTSSGAITDSATEISGDLLPNINWGHGSNENYGTAEDQLILGGGNRYNETVRGLLITGNENKVGDYAKQVFICNSSGIFIPSGHENVSVFNTFNKRINEDNTFIIAGQKLYGDGAVETIQFSVGTKTRGTDDMYGSVLFDTSSGDITYQLDDPREWPGLKRSYKKISNDANNVILIPFSGAIDNASNLTFNTYNKSYTITTDGTNYYIMEEYG